MVKRVAVRVGFRATCGHAPQTNLPMSSNLSIQATQVEWPTGIPSCPDWRFEGDFRERLIRRQATQSPSIGSAQLARPGRVASRCRTACTQRGGPGDLARLRDAVHRRHPLRWAAPPRRRRSSRPHPANRCRCDVAEPPHPRALGRPPDRICRPERQRVPVHRPTGFGDSSPRRSTQPVPGSSTGPQPTRTPGLGTSADVGRGSPSLWGDRTRCGHQSRCRVRLAPGGRLE